jgi:hypothetical protein
VSDRRALAGARWKWLLVLLFVLSLPAVTRRIYASDEVQYFSWLRSIAFDHDANFENEYQYFYDSGATHTALFHETFLEKLNDNGRPINFTPIGSALLWSPFYAAGHVVAIVTGAPQDGFSKPYISAVAIGSACYGMLAVFLSIAIARRVVGHGAAAGAAIWIGTPLVYYMYITPPFSHACSAFAVALFLWTWLRVRERWTIGGAALVGITGALLPMVREQDLFFVVGPALDFVVSGAQRRDVAQKIPAAIAGIVAFVLAYSPQLLAYQALNGRLWVDSHVNNKMSWSSPHGLQVLFSPEHGLFAWTPLAVVAIVGLVLLAMGRLREGAPDAQWFGILALVMVGLQAYIAGAVESWTVSGSFGQRRFVGLTPLLTVGLATLAVMIVRSGRVWARRAFVALVGLCIWWNVGLMIQFGMNTMDRGRLTLRQNAWTTFVTLPPQLPATVWQYFTNRSAFYGRPRQ